MHRTVRLSLLVSSALVCLFLAACGASGGQGAYEPPGVDASLYKDYKAKCLEATSTLNQANVVYDPDIDMTRGVSSPR